MASSSSTGIPSHPPTCLARSIVATLDREPALEAVTLNHDRESIAIATFGGRRGEGLAARVAQAVEEGQQVSAAHRCALLAGDGNCHSCDIPLSVEEAKYITINQGQEATTIARVTCPTAPRLWSWRSIVWPKFAPREMPVP